MSWTGLQPELERRHHAEVAAAAAQRPEQVRVRPSRSRPGSCPSAVTTSADTRLSQRQPAAARQVADAAAEGQPADSRRGDDPAGRRQAEGVGARALQVAPRSRRRRRGRSGRAGSTRTLRKSTEVDDHAAVAGPEAAGRCASRRAPRGRFRAPGRSRPRPGRRRRPPRARPRPAACRSCRCRPGALRRSRGPRARPRGHGTAPANRRSSAWPLGPPAVRMYPSRSYLVSVRRQPRARRSMDAGDAGDRLLNQPVPHARSRRLSRAGSRRPVSRSSPSGRR